jgi:hypothetical protein
MIIVKLQGGIGNQLFQYAIGASLAHHNNDFIKLDICWFEFNSYRQYALSYFNIRENLASDQEIDLFFQNKTFLRIKKRLRKIHNQIFNIEYFPYPASLTYCLETKVYEPELFSVLGDIYLEGFWQNYKYILPEVEQRLRLEFTIKHPLRKEVSLIQERIQASYNSVALHIRRGDYVSNKTYAMTHGFIGVNYYSHALHLLNEKLGEFDIYVFTDDPMWVKANLCFLNKEFIIVSDSSLFDFEELYLMSKCNHQIIANSTFSWWGAWLNTNCQKIVIAPKIWMLDSYIDSNNIILPTWISI